MPGRLRTASSPSRTWMRAAGVVVLLGLCGLAGHGHVTFLAAVAAHDRLVPKSGESGHSDTNEGRTRRAEHTRLHPGIPRPVYRNPVTEPAVNAPDVDAGRIPAAASHGLPCAPGSTYRPAATRLSAGALSRRCHAGRARRAPSAARASSSAPTGPVMTTLVTTSGPEFGDDPGQQRAGQQPQLGRPGGRLGADAQLAVAQRARRAVRRDVGADDRRPVGEHPRLGQRPLPAAVGEVAGDAPRPIGCRVVRVRPRAGVPAAPAGSPVVRLARVAARRRPRARRRRARSAGAPAKRGA